MNTDIKVSILNPFFFQISTCQHSASAFFFPWGFGRHRGYSDVGTACATSLTESVATVTGIGRTLRKRGRPMDAEKKHELQGKQNSPPWKPDIQKNTKKIPNKCSTSEKHDTGGIVKGSGTPSCFGFCWQVRVAQAWNSPLMGGCGRLKLQGESSGVCHTICRPSNGVSHVTSSTFKQFFKNPGFFHGSKFSWHGEDVNSWDPGSLGAWYLQWIGG